MTAFPTASGPAEKCYRSPGGSRRFRQHIEMTLSPLTVPGGPSSCSSLRQRSTRNGTCVEAATAGWGFDRLGHVALQDHRFADGAGLRLPARPRRSAFVRYASARRIFAGPRRHLANLCRYTHRDTVLMCSDDLHNRADESNARPNSGVQILAQIDDLRLGPDGSEIRDRLVADDTSSGSRPASALAMPMRWR